MLTTNYVALGTAKKTVNTTRFNKTQRNRKLQTLYLKYFVSAPKLVKVTS